MLDWLQNKIRPVPHLAELKGLTLTQAERKLRRDFGYSRSQAKHYIWQHKARLLNG